MRGIKGREFAVDRVSEPRREVAGFLAATMVLNRSSRLGAATILGEVVSIVTMM